MSLLQICVKFSYFMNLYCLNMNVVVYYLNTKKIMCMIFMCKQYK